MTETVKWLSELLTSRSIFKEKDNGLFKTFVQNNTNKNYLAPKLDQIFSQENLEEELEDAIFVLQSLLELGEYKKCAFLAQSHLNGGGNKCNKIIFYYAYSTFLFEDRKKKEDRLSEEDSEN